ncbi:MAG: hypothetical protein EHM24_19815 [Acidobacteria bacterium]|nr:MAG: hypothetical protein EHM24_19815 [Acidobacteriota bacterium]
MSRRAVSLATTALSVLMLGLTAGANQETKAALTIRGKTQTLRLYGPRGGPPVVVSSGDGGWIHLAPHVAQLLSARGFFVVGFDSRAYLWSFTSRDGPLRQTDVPGDYRVLADFASAGSGTRPVLVGVSEGAGLSVLASSGSTARERVQGVVAIGLPEKNELGWRWRDAAVYLTHGVPHEPMFHASDVVGGVSPAPLAEIHSTRDEFVPLDILHTILAHASEPKRVWTVTASNHGFTDNLHGFDLALIEAMDWVARQAPRRP